MDSQFIWNSVLTIAMTIISGLIAIGARYLTQIQDSLRERMDNQDNMIKQIREDYKSDLCTVSGKVETAQEDLGKFKVLVQREFVNRDEYIRTTQSLDAKMDRVLGEIGTINVNVAKLAAAQEVKK
jgi:hypothetical protein